MHFASKKKVDQHNSWYCGANRAHFATLASVSGSNKAANCTQLRGLRQRRTPCRPGTPPHGWIFTVRLGSIWELIDGAALF